MYYGCLISLHYGLFIGIKHTQITWTDTICKFEKLKFVAYFFNKDISFNISLKCLRFSANVDDSHSEGSMSQNFYLGPSFYLIQSRKKKRFKK